MFTAMFDVDSLAEIVRLQGFSALLDPGITSALAEAGTLLVAVAQNNTWQVFDHPTGALADSITFYVPSPEEVAVTVGVPYGHRREYSFKGPDALGRMFPNDIPRPYLVPAVEKYEQPILDLMSATVNNALGRIATG